MNIYTQRIKSRKKSILRFLLTGVCQVVLCTSLYANKFDLEDVSKEGHQQYYNSLPSVEDNNELLSKSPHFQSFLREAEEIATRYELEASVGLRLIHRHFALDKGQMMAEQYEVINKIPSLVTSAHYFEEAQENGAIPSSWIFGSSHQDEAVLFEASTDPAIKTAVSSLEKSPEFFDEMGGLLIERQMNNLLSVAVLRRDSLAAKEGQMYMEVNSPKNVSIIQIWSENNLPGDAIRTSWSFSGPKQQRCWDKHYCLQRTPENGGHLYVHSHDYIRDAQTVISLNTGKIE